MNNNGTKPWTTDGTPHNLGSQNPQDNTRWGIGRVGLPFQPVNPGQNAVFSFNATAPSTADSYPFDWKMVEDGIEWFGDTCAKIIEVTAAPFDEITCERCSTVNKYAWAQWPSGPDGLCDTVDDNYGAATYTCNCACTAGSNTSWNPSCVASCAPSPNQPPSATSLSNNNSTLDYCSYTPSYIILSWVFSDEPGDTQGAYRVQVTRQSDGTTYDSGQRSGIISSITAQTINTEKGSNFIWYGDSYTWQVKVWDNHDAESAWASGSFFTTPKHAYPDVYPPYDFIWNPLKPAVGENTQFTDRSACYNINNNPVPCSGNGPCGTPWCWTFQNGNPANSKQQNPLVKFLSTGAKSVTLRVTDSDGFICQTQKTVSSQLPLPEWIEISPF